MAFFFLTTCTQVSWVGCALGAAGCTAVAFERPALRLALAGRTLLLSPGLVGVARMAFLLFLTLAGGLSVIDCALLVTVTFFFPLPPFELTAVGWWSTDWVTPPRCDMFAIVSASVGAGIPNRLSNTRSTMPSSLRKIRR